MILNQGLDGSSLIVQGNDAANHIQVSFGDGGWTVSDDSGVFAGDGCAPASGSAVSCADVGRDRAGRDHRRRRQRRHRRSPTAFPTGVHVRANGNAGSDSISGGPGDDVLEAGENYNNPDNGNDTLIGNGGSDVLYADPGADQLSGGPGDDLLVSSVAVCQGHTYDGGPGEDTVSYGRSDAALTVELGGTGGPGGLRQPRPGRLAATRASRDPTGPTC